MYKRILSISQTKSNNKTLQIIAGGGSLHEVCFQMWMAQLCVQQKGSCWGQVDQQQVQCCWRPSRCCHHGRQGQGQVFIMAKIFFKYYTHIHTRYPNSYLAMVGISAGCGLLMSYLGSQPNTPIKATAALCPAYDIERAFR